MPSAYTFPTLTGHNNLPDSSKYEVTVEDPSISSDSEGGYKFTRARFTRAPREKRKIGYTRISASNMQLIRDFYKLVRGGSASFNWTDPESGDVLEVRFVGELQFSYVGLGGAKLWDCSFEVEEL